MSYGFFLNLILNKTGGTDIQFFYRTEKADIGMFCDVRLIGRYYKFLPLTCNAAF